MIVSFLLILTYVIIYVTKHGIPHSLSQTYYGITYKVLFSITIILASILLFPKMLEVTPENLQFLAFLTLMGIIAVGCSPNFKDSSMIDNIHMISAGMSLITSQLLILLTNPWILLCWIYIIAYIINYVIKNNQIKNIFIDSNIIFWSEIIMMLTIYTYLLC